MDDLLGGVWLEGLKRVTKFKDIGDEWLWSSWNMLDEMGKKVFPFLLELSLTD